MSDWIDIAAEADIGEGQARLVEDNGTRIAVFNLGGRFYAMEDTCTHDGWALLGSGLAPETLIEGDQIICPRHGARFCIRTGEALTPPAFEPAKTHAVRVENGRLLLRRHPG